MSLPRKSKRFPKALKAVRHLSRVDPQLGHIIREVGPVKIEMKEETSIFESLVVSIIYQQLHGKAAAAITRRFEELFSKNGKFPTPQKVLRMDLKHLRAVGLSESKGRAILDLAEKVKDRRIPNRTQAEEMSDEALIEALTQVKGVGPWTAQMLLIFTLGRVNVFPVLDYGVRKGYALLRGLQQLPTPKELEASGAHWSPYRSVASWYLWRITELERFQKVKF